MNHIRTIDMEEITTRYAELRDERADLATAADEAHEAEGEAIAKRDAMPAETGPEPVSDEYHDAHCAVEDAETAHADALAALGDWITENGEELEELASLIEELRGAGGGDHLWEGDWFPGQLINVNDFEDYAQELAEGTGMVNDNASWPNNCIDWERAARELAMDYSMVTFRGSDYYWR